MGAALKDRLRQSRFESRTQEALLSLLVASAHMHEQVERLCAEHGITASQYNVLRILRGVHPDGHPRCEVARRMIDRAPDVTRLIDRLERGGWVERGRSDCDRRLSISRITAAGLELLARMAPDLDRLHRGFARHLSLRDCRELSRICAAIYAERAG
jgi:DNA-binding MarR family transcriptional regulator